MGGWGAYGAGKLEGLVFYSLEPFLVHEETEDEYQLTLCLTGFRRVHETRWKWKAPGASAQDHLNSNLLKDGMRAKTILCK